MTQLLDHRLKVVLMDGRHLVGQMIAFDKHMNLVMADCEEFRKRGTSEHKRTLGLVVLRGENTVSISVEAGPPPKNPKSRVSASVLMGHEILPRGSGPIQPPIVLPPGFKPPGIPPSSRPQ